MTRNCQTLSFYRYSSETSSSPATTMTPPGAELSAMEESLTNTLFLATRHNESQIVTINTSDESGNISGLLMEVIANIDAAYPEPEGDAPGQDQQNIGAEVVNMSDQEGLQNPLSREELLSSFNDELLDEEERSKANSDSTSNEKIE